MDIWALAAIVAKAAEYAAVLLAIGGAFFVATFPTAPRQAVALARRLAVIAALVALALLALRFGLRAGRISGMGLAGAGDPVMLGLIWDSPLGNAAMWRIAGAALILGLLVKGALGRSASLLGAVVLALSYTLVGHALGDPRWVLAGLLAVHLLAVAFWVGALAPLCAATAQPGGAALLHRFGVIASGTVAALVLVGLVFAWLMVGSVAGLFSTAYGLTLLAKLGAVAVLLGLAAGNKLRLVPALAAGDAAAADRLHRAIRLEGVAVALILLATATLTTVTTPPVNL
ncbi:MAG: CopD family protein [Pseudomonadota bacterium]